MCDIRFVLFTSKLVLLLLLLLWVCHLYTIWFVVTKRESKEKKKKYRQKAQIHNKKLLHHCFVWFCFNVFLTCIVRIVGWVFFCWFIGTKYTNTPKKIGWPIVRTSETLPFFSVSLFIIMHDQVNTIMTNLNNIRIQIEKSKYQQQRKLLHN